MKAVLSLHLSAIRTADSLSVGRRKGRKNKTSALVLVTVSSILNSQIFFQQFASPQTCCEQSSSFYDHGMSVDVSRVKGQGSQDGQEVRGQGSNPTSERTLLLAHLVGLPVLDWNDGGRRTVGTLLIWWGTKPKSESQLLFLVAPRPKIKHLIRLSLFIQ